MTNSFEKELAVAYTSIIWNHLATWQVNDL